MSSKTGYPMVVSDAEIDLAVEALRRLPGRKHLPRAWDRTKVIEQIRLAVGPAPVPDLAYLVAPGIDAVVAPFGSDKLGAALDDRWQVLLLVRQAPLGQESLWSSARSSPSGAETSRGGVLLHHFFTIVVGLLMLGAAASSLPIGH